MAAVDGQNLIPPPDLQGEIGKFAVLLLGVGAQLHGIGRDGLHEAQALLLQIRPREMDHGEHDAQQHHRHDGHDDADEPDPQFFQQDSPTSRW